jgi:hypothetical protein
MTILNKLISFNGKLSSEFIRHIESTNNVCVYRLGSHKFPGSICFPNAKAVTLINCSNIGVMNILDMGRFPNLSRINYLSAHPGNYDIYERFPDSMEWIFPNKDYEFYNFMVSQGRGKKDKNLIKEYISNKKIVDGKNGFDISFEFDLNIPGFGITNGNWWQSQFYEYLVMNQNKPAVAVQKQEMEELTLEKQIVRQEIENAYFEDMIEKH